MGRVLIFDDDPDILELCSVLLRVKGYETHCSTTCKNILKKIRDFNPQVILMDNWIPESGGVEATRLIKNTEDLKQIPVIFFSASNEVQEYAEKATADYFLRKPFDIAELHNAVSTAISNSSQNSVSREIPEA